MHSFEQLERYYRWVTWFGLALNLLFIVPLYVTPQFALDLFRVDANPEIWPRTGGMLLLTISVFYIPATLDLRRYWVYAWLAIVPSRAQGALFFFAAVLVFDYPKGYLPIAAVDASIALVQLFVLLQARRALADEVRRSQGE